MLSRIGTGDLVGAGVGVAGKGQGYHSIGLEGRMN